MNPSLARRTERLLPALLALVYAIVAGITTVARAAYEIDADEGFNLMKVLLVERGHSLYGAIWSDQPPIFTYLGVLFLRLFGEHAESVRFVTVLLSAALVFALADLARRELPGRAGLVACVATALLLPLGGRFAAYGMAAMIGLPSIAFAVLSLYALLLARSRPLFLLAAGLLFALSLGTKLFTLFLLPVFGAVLAAELLRADRAARPARLRQLLKDGALFGLAACVGVALWLGPIAATGQIQQLYASHGGAKSFGAPAFRALLGFMLPDAWLYVLGAIGFGVAISRKSSFGVVLGVWALLSVFVLSSHTPLWRHHTLLIAVPSAALGGLLLGYVAEWDLPRLSAKLRLGVVVALLAVPFVLDVIAYAPRQVSGKRRARYEQQDQVEAVVRKRAPRARLMVTSRQMYAFHLGLEVPPELAVTSSKRFRSGQLTPALVRSLIQKRKPDVVVVDNRWQEETREAVADAVARNYELVFTAELAFNAKVYVRRPPRKGASGG